MTPSSADRRLLLVHAHPDDESIGTGATMAKYAAEGAQVTLVTCTLGELGEIIPPGLAHLAADRTGGLGEYRIGELAAACAALGVTDHRFLGGPGRWRDSGMMGTPGNDAPGCFWRADLDEAAGALAEIIREVQPQVVVCYDGNGGYGHPDHIQAHRVTRRAFRLAAGPLPAGLRPAASRPVGSQSVGPQPTGSRPAAKLYATAAPGSPQATTEIDATAYLPAKVAAMRAHATQITLLDDGYFALSNNIRQPLGGREYYTLLDGPAGALLDGPAGALLVGSAGGLGGGSAGGGGPDGGLDGRQGGGPDGGQGGGSDGGQGGGSDGGQGVGPDGDLGVGPDGDLGVGPDGGLGVGPDGGLGVGPDGEPEHDLFAGIA
jgi:N-acetyl-1-D-myo-inositol-2-amino-2-deoxy-alpha-D-glucopyranoside deacetylase